MSAPIVRAIGDSTDGVKVLELDGITYLLLTATPHETIVEWMHRRQRAEAFCAIRRAVKVAREYDAEYQANRHGGSCSAESARAHVALIQAYGIRQAIRDAIGSDKRPPENVWEKWTREVLRQRTKA